MRKWIFLLSVALLLTGCNEQHPEGASLQGEAKSNLETDQKNVISIIIDSMTTELIEKAQKEGNVPALSFLIEHGQLHENIIAPFPTMSVVIESTLVTGVEPDEHQVPGLVWYNENEKRLINYGSTTPGVVKLGMKEALHDTLYHLNNTHLSKDTQTIFEVLQKEGFSTGAINTLVYRGETEHEMTLPFPFNNLTDRSKPLKTKGPDLLSFGELVKPKAVENKKLHDSFYQNYGLNDTYSAEVVEGLVKSKEQPDFLMVFFPDFDKEAHHHGPDYVSGFEDAEFYLQQILNSFDSWEQALEENIFIVFGDHGQDAVYADKGKAAIELEPLLEPYTVASLFDQPESADLIIANNHRMVYLYQGLLKGKWSEIIPPLLKDERLDHLAYLEGEELVIKKPLEREELRVKKGETWQDEFNQRWDITGDATIVDVTFDQTKQKVQYGEYPDVFSQLFNALNSHSSPLILTAKPGYVIKSESSPVHAEGGEHGGLHKNDTIAAMIIAGTNKEPLDRRMTAFKPYVLSLFGIEG